MKLEAPVPLGGGASAFWGKGMALLVNGELVTDRAFFEAYGQLGGFAIDATATGATGEAATLRRFAERRVLGSVLLRQMALQAGFTVSAEEVSARRFQQWGTSSASVCGVAIQQQLANDLLVEKYCHWLTRHEPRPSRVEVEHYYTRHRAEFLLPERIRVAQIVCNVEVPSEEAAARIRIAQAEQELTRGTDFAKVAERYSDCGGKAMLGWVARGTMVQNFEEVVFALPERGLSGIFRTVFGFHIAMALERKAVSFEPLEALRPVLARRMHEERRRHVVDTAIEQAIRTARIEAAPADKVSV